eukprot:COSAG05_NODE_10793_length_546_cov_1.131991_1_plen_168_part_01
MYPKVSQDPYITLTCEREPKFRVGSRECSSSSSSSSSNSRFPLKVLGIVLRTGYTRHALAGGRDILDFAPTPLQLLSSLTLLFPLLHMLPQEEMCRQQWEAHGLKIVVLRPDYIVDMDLKLGRHREPLDPSKPMPAGNIWSVSVSIRTRTAIPSHCLLVSAHAIRAVL